MELSLIEDRTWPLDSSHVVCMRATGGGSVYGWQVCSVGSPKPFGREIFWTLHRNARIPVSHVTNGGELGHLDPRPPGPYTNRPQFARTNNMGRDSEAKTPILIKGKFHRRGRLFFPVPSWTIRLRKPAYVIEKTLGHCGVFKYRNLDEAPSGWQRDPYGLWSLRMGYRS